VNSVRWREDFVKCGARPAAEEVIAWVVVLINQS
jgi:hypothetical protein